MFLWISLTSFRVLAHCRGNKKNVFNNVCLFFFPPILWSIQRWCSEMCRGAVLHWTWLLVQTQIRHPDSRVSFPDVWGLQQQPGDPLEKEATPTGINTPHSALCRLCHTYRAMESYMWRLYSILAALLSPTYNSLQHVAYLTFMNSSPKTQAAVEGKYLIIYQDNFRLHHWTTRNSKLVKDK